MKPSLPTTTSKSRQMNPLATMRGMGAWLAVVRTYQQCSDTLSEGIKPLGLKLAQHEVLVNLLLSTTLTQQELAQRSFVTKSHMSAVLIDMAANGWVSRQDSKQDKRTKKITLTPRGKVLAKQALDLQAQVVEVMMGTLSNTQVKDIQDFSLNAYKALVLHHAALVREHAASDEA